MRMKHRESKDWIPAFAGMTVLNPCRSVSTHFKPRQPNTQERQQPDCTMGDGGRQRGKLRRDAAWKRSEGGLFCFFSFCFQIWLEPVDK